MLCLAHRGGSFHTKLLIGMQYFVCLRNVGFLQKHIEYITEHAIDPDKISRINPLEAVRHYIDIENYGENPFDNIPIYWKMQ